MRKSVTGAIILQCLVLLSSQCLPGVGASADANANVDNFPAPKTGLESKSDAVQGHPLKFLTRLEKTIREQYGAEAPNRNSVQEVDVENPFSDQVKDNVIKDVCDRYDVDGCNIPGDLPFFYKKLFTPSCNRHDICYSCGVDYHDDRLTCDRAFLKNMENACKKMPSPYKSQSDHDLQKWNVLSSSNRSQDEVSLHRQKVQALIEEKSSILHSIYQREFDSLKEDDDQAINHLMNPEEMSSLLKRVLLKWILFSANNLKVDNDYRRLNQDDTTEGVNESNRQGEDDKVCKQVLLEADRVSMQQQQYRVPDMIYDMCTIFAKIYYLAVRIGGGSNYRRKAEYYCHKDFIKYCLPN